MYWRSMFYGDSEQSENIFIEISRFASCFMQTLDHLKTASEKVIDQAIEFFRPYREDLGKLWDQLVQAGKDIHAGIIGEGAQEN